MDHNNKLQKSESVWHEWNELPDVYVRLEKDDVGYPPKAWEQLKAEPTDVTGVYRLRNTPFYARGLAIGDEVSTGTSSEGYAPVVESVVKRSGYSTVRLAISSHEDHRALVDYFVAYGCQLEFCKEVESQLVAIAIPKNALDNVTDYIVSEKVKGRWDAEDGYIADDKE